MCPESPYEQHLCPFFPFRPSKPYPSPVNAANQLNHLSTYHRLSNHDTISSSGQRREELPPRAVCLRRFGVGRMLQHIPCDVLQELQQQGEGETESQGSQGGTQSRGGRGVATLTPPEDETSLSLAPQNSSLTGSSSSSTALLSPSWSPPPPGEIRGRRFGDGVGIRQLPTLQLSRLRPAVGPGSAPSPPRSPTSEAVPSQLIGGRLRSNADLLSEQAQEPVIHPQTYHSARRNSAVARLRDLLSPPKARRYVV